MGQRLNNANDNLNDNLNDNTMKVIAANAQPRLKGRGYAETQTSEQLNKLLSEGWLKEMVEAIRQGDEKKKDQLPYICPHYTQFKDNHRAQSAIIPEAFTFMTCVDVDDATKVREAFEKALAVNKDEDSEWQDMVLRIEYSARKKGHIYIRIPKGMTIEEAQRGFCEELGMPELYDPSCITPERFIYVTGIDEEVYRSEHWLEALSKEELEERREAYLQRGLDVDGRKLVGTQSASVAAATDTNSKAASETSLKGSPCGSDAHPADAGTLFVFDACMKEAELTPDVLVEGSNKRHLALKSILSVGATQLLTKEELLGVLQVRMADFVNENDCRQLVEDFYTKYYDPNQKLSAFQRKTLAKRLKMAKDAGSALQSTQPASVAASAQVAGEPPAYPTTPPKMPTKLPKVVALLLSKTPDVYKPAVAHAIFPALGAHLWKVRFPYIDNVKHEATFMNVLMAGTGAGKDCVSQPINHIMKDIRARDAENLKREAEWKKEVNSKGANKDKRQRPEGLVIQEVDPDMTNPAFVMRMAEADDHFLYTKMNEIDQFDALRGSGRGQQQFQIMCLAFDPDNRYGQTRVGTQSVTEKVTIRFNWNAATTIQKGQRYFRNVLTDGPISRINFCTIPEREIGADMPVYGTYDAAFDEELRPFIDRLTRAAGTIDCPQAFKLAKKMSEENAEFARLSQSRVYENLSFRANVIAYLKACVLYIMNDYKWAKEIEEFVRWSLKYDMWCKMEFFGAAIQQANEEGERVVRPGARNLLELLPDEFTQHDAEIIRQSQGMPIDGTANMLYQWVYRKYVLRLTPYNYRKLKFLSDESKAKLA